MIFPTLHPTYEFPVLPEITDFEFKRPENLNFGIHPHHTLGDAARPLDDPRPCSRSGHAPSSSVNSIPNFQKYDQAEDENESTSRFPAIKLTFRDPVNISQFKIIQVIIFDLDFMIKIIYILEHYARTRTIIWK